MSQWDFEFCRKLEKLEKRASAVCAQSPARSLPTHENASLTAVSPGPSLQSAREKAFLSPRTSRVALCLCLRECERHQEQPVCAVATGAGMVYSLCCPPAGGFSPLCEIFLHSSSRWFQVLAVKCDSDAAASFELCRCRHKPNAD